MAEGLIDYYALLGVPRTASKAEIKKAWNTAVKMNHPDKVLGGDPAENGRQFIKIQEAKEFLLGTTVQRHSYDKRLEKWEKYDKRRSTSVSVKATKVTKSSTKKTSRRPFQNPTKSSWAKTSRSKASASDTFSSKFSEQTKSGKKREKYQTQNDCRWEQNPLFGFRTNWYSFDFDEYKKGDWKDYSDLHWKWYCQDAPSYDSQTESYILTEARLEQERQQVKMDAFASNLTMGGAVIGIGASIITAVLAFKRLKRAWARRRARQNTNDAALAAMPPLQVPVPAPPQTHGHFLRSRAAAATTGGDQPNQAAAIIFERESILDKRVTKRGRAFQIEYLLRWRNPSGPEYYDEWVNKKQLFAAQGLIIDYEAHQQLFAGEQ